MADQTSPIMTVDQAAKHLGLEPLTLRRLAMNGGIPAFRIGRQWRFMRELIDEWLAERSESNREHPQV